MVENVDIEKVQRMLTDLTDQTIDSVVEYITKENYITNHLLTNELIDNILQIPYIRHNNLKILALLCTRIIENPESQYFIDNFVDQLITQMDSKLILLQMDLFHFAQELYNVKFPLFDKIVMHMQAYNYKNRPMNLSLFDFTVFYFFTDELLAYNKEVFEETQHFFKFMTSNMMAAFLLMFTGLDNGVNVLDSNGMPLYKNCMIELGDETIHGAIIRDDVDFLIKTSAVGQFDVNKLIHYEISESSFLRGEHPVLAFAAFYGSIKIVRYLLINGADLTYRDKQNRTFADFACAGGNNEIIRLLDQAGVRFDEALSTAIEFRQTDVFRWLMETHGDDGDFLVKSLIAGAHTNSIEAMKIALDCGVDVNAMAKYGTNEIVQTAIFSAASSGSCDAIRLLHSAGADVNLGSAAGLPPIQGAVQSKMVNAIKLLISLGADINLKSRRGKTAVVLAAHYGQVDLIKLLMEYPQCDLGIRTTDNKSILHVAVQNRSLSSVEYLLTLPQVDANARDDTGATPMIVAAEGASESIINALSSCERVDINAQDERGWTPLHCAAYNGNEKAIKILLKNSADKTIKNKEGKTPREMTENPNIIRELSDRCVIA